MEQISAMETDKILVKELIHIKRTKFMLLNLKYNLTLQIHPFRNSLLRVYFYVKIDVLNLGL